MNHPQSNLVGGNADPIPFISIVVPVHNEEENIEACILSLLNTEYPCKEIIVVNDGSTDKTAEIAAKYPVKIVHINKKSGSASARNMGASIAKGDIIAFIDGDCLADRYWLKNLAACYANPQVGGVGGPYRSLKVSYLSRCIDSAIEGALSLNGKFREFKGPMLAGCNICFRKNIFDKVGGFNSSLPTAGDNDICVRTMRAGYALTFEPKAIVWHNWSRPLEYLKCQFKWGASDNANFYVKHFRQYSRWKLELLSRTLFVLLPFALLAGFYLSALITSIVLITLSIGFIVLFFPSLRRMLRRTIKIAKTYKNPTYLVTNPILELSVFYVHRCGTFWGLIHSAFSNFALHLKRLW